MLVPVQLQACIDPSIGPAPHVRRPDRDVYTGILVVSAGSFAMGSPPDEPRRYDDACPAHDRTIAEPVAIVSTDVCCSARCAV